MQARLKQSAQRSGRYVDIAFTGRPAHQPFRWSGSCRIADSKSDRTLHSL